MILVFIFLNHVDRPTLLMTLNTLSHIPTCCLSYPSSQCLPKLDEHSDGIYFACKQRRSFAAPRAYRHIHQWPLIIVLLDIFEFKDADFVTGFGMQDHSMKLSPRGHRIEWRRDQRNRFSWVEGFSVTAERRASRFCIYRGQVARLSKVYSDIPPILCIARKLDNRNWPYQYLNF